jgi:ABC-type antimicrobial peptide transport system permease subunit
MALTCLNVMNLLLARARLRQRAVRIRMSLGAVCRRVLTQLLVESTMLALEGGAVALFSRTG